MTTSDCIDNSTETVSSSSSNTNTNENDTDSSSSSSSATTSSQLLSQELCIRARGAPRGMPGRCESPLLFDPDLYTIVGGTTTQQALLGSGLPLLSSSSSVAALGRRLEQEPCTQHSDCARKHCAHVTDPHGSCTTDGEGCVCISDPVCEIGFIPADAQVRKRPDGFALQGCMTGEACVAVRDQIVAMVTYGIWARCMSRAVMDRRRPFLVEYSHSLHGITASANSSDRDANGTTSTAITPTPVGGSNESSSDDEGASSGNNDDDGDEGVCMDARLLMHLSQEDLVYTRGKEPRAVTLCDTRGSCATPGHMVTWHGKAMTMKTWCLHHASGGGVDGEKEEEGGGCVRRVMKVNSPRVSGGGMMGGRQWQRRVRTKTMDLEFTALAARYGTAVEEGLLRLLVRLGV